MTLCRLKLQLSDAEFTVTISFPEFGDSALTLQVMTPHMAVANSIRRSVDSLLNRSKSLFVRRCVLVVPVAHSAIAAVQL